LQIYRLIGAFENLIRKLPLEEIQERFPQAPVLIACGYTFSPQVKEVVRKCIELELDWFITDHPSRCDYANSIHYNPKKWKNKNIVKTGLMQKVNKEMNL